jgi:hypothetical protein
MMRKARFLIVAAGILASPFAALADESDELPALAPEGSEAPMDAQLSDSQGDELEAPSEAQAEIPPPTDSESAEVPLETAVSEAYSYNRIPLYQRHRPEWAASLSAAPQAFGNQNPSASQTGSGDVLGFSLQWEFQPQVLQEFGVLGFGAGLQLYPVFPETEGVEIAGSKTSNWSIGGQVRYQARFFREQILVPFAGFQLESLAYRYSGNQVARTTLQGPIFGGMLLLNALEPSAAGDIFSNHGISRSYLVAELRALTGGDSEIQIDGSSLFFGLRIEY